MKLPSLLLWFPHFQLLRCPLLSLHTLLQRPHFPTKDAESIFPEGRQEDFPSPLGLEEYWKIMIFLVSQIPMIYKLVLALQLAFGTERERLWKRERETSCLFNTLVHSMWHGIFHSCSYPIPPSRIFLPFSKTQIEHVTLLLGTFILIEICLCVHCLKIFYFSLFC